MIVNVNDIMSFQYLSIIVHECPNSHEQDAKVSGESWESGNEGSQKIN
jgi:hypothetical protein